MTFPARLPRFTRVLIGGDGFANVGLGMTVPLVLISLHQVRDIALPVIGLLLAATGLTTLVVLPVAGIVLDRVGPRRVVHVALAATAASQAGLA